MAALTAAMISFQLILPQVSVQFCSPPLWKDAHLRVARVKVQWWHKKRRQSGGQRNPGQVSEDELFSKSDRTIKGGLLQKYLMKQYAISELPFSPVSKRGLVRKPFIWNLVLFTCKFWFIYMWIKLTYTWKGFARDLALKQAKYIFPHETDPIPCGAWLLPEC